MMLDFLKGIYQDTADDVRLDILVDAAGTSTPSSTPRSNVHRLGLSSIDNGWGITVRDLAGAATGGLNGFDDLH